jgi:deoxyribodipyrimidine photo-lyase
MKLFWMHSDCVRPVGGAVFVFDPKQIEREGWGLKRLLFLYECLPAEVEIYKGSTVEILSALALERGATLVTEASPDPWIREQIASLSIEALPAPPFAGPVAEADLKRFSRYWKKVEARLLTP